MQFREAKNIFLEESAIRSIRLPLELEILGWKWPSGECMLQEYPSKSPSARHSTETLVSQVVNHYFPSLLAIDPTRLEGNRRTRAVKVFAEVPAADPLLTKCELEMEGGATHKISFKHKKIQPLCLYCGRLATCLNNAAGEGRTWSWGCPATHQASTSHH
ncbi:hypothetical protein LINPERPRIM_LOCUS16871 [Linum perenne]